MVYPLRIRPAAFYGKFFENLRLSYKSINIYRLFNMQALFFYIQANNF